MKANRGRYSLVVGLVVWCLAWVTTPTSPLADEVVPDSAPQMVLTLDDAGDSAVEDADANLTLDQDEADAADATQPEDGSAEPGATADETEPTEPAAAPDEGPMTSPDTAATADPTTSEPEPTDDEAAPADPAPLSAPTQSGWVQEDGSYRYYVDGSPRTGWLVCDTDPQGTKIGMQRYWLGPDGRLVTGALISASEAGWWAYARPEGYVVRGRYRNPSTGNVYLADNDGRLLAPGWHVSGDYGQGLQRYYVDPDSHACVPGYSTKSWPHLTRPEGYVARGKYRASDGRVYLANGDGRLERDGWLVSTAYGDGLQRYYVDPDSHACVPGYSTKSWPHYTRPEGYVVRGRYTSGSTIWLADRNGRVAGDGKGGWLCTSAFGAGTQRYYIDPTTHGIKAGLNHVGDWWFYTRPEGYVVRGSYVTGNDVYVADNEGRLPNLSKNGWVVTKSYGQGLQRYYIYAKTHAARRGYSADGYPHYTLSAGYVLRGRFQLGEGVLLADNDGRLATKRGWLESAAYGNGRQRYYLQACCTGGLVGAQTGLFSVDGRLYYGLPGKGYVVRNDRVSAKGMLYAADSTGALTSLYPASVTNMVMRANHFSSPTGWLVMVDTSATKVCIFTGWQGNWSLVRWFDCSCGAGSSPTVKGTFSIGSRGYSFGEEKGYSCYYWTQFYRDYLFHSVLYYPNTRAVQDGRLGMHISHGCVRLDINDAYYINQNVPSGTTVNVV